MFMPMDDFDTSFSFISVIFVIMFIVIMGVFLWAIVNGIIQWNKNNHSPRLTVNASVVSKRIEIDRNESDDDFSTTTWNYVTFQVESGDRMEFLIGGREYGLLVESDVGMLTFQGTRYLSFERQ